MLGAVAGAFLATREAKRRGYPAEIVWDLMIYLLIGGIIGARIWHLLTPPPSSVITAYWYFTHPLDALNIRKGGLGIPITGTKNGELRTSLTTPSGVSGTKGLRVAMKRDAYSSPCETFTYGEVEDYTVNFGSKDGEILLSDPSLEIKSYPGIKIYPNPAHRQLHIDNETGDPYQVRIFSLQGKLIFEANYASEREMIDTGLIKPGLYLIRIVSKQQEYTYKLLVF